VEKKMLELLVWAFWSVFGAYSIWYFSQAETLQPVSIYDLTLTWEMHKLQTGCNASRLNCLFAKNGEIVGFDCECGYRFLQKRILTQKANEYASRSIFADVLRARSSSQELGIHYSCIKEI